MGREVGLDKPNGRLPRVAFYLRRSAEEVVDNYSIETQERVCREKADRVFGVANYRVVGIFTDPGRSGRLGLGRPGMPDRKYRRGLTELIEQIDQDGIDAVVVYKLDRLARRLRLLLDLLDDHFVPHGADLYSAGEEVDIVSAQGRFTVQLLGVVAEWYSAQAAERTRDGIRNRRAQGFQVGTPCYGWRLQTRGEADGGRRTLVRKAEEGRWLLHMRDRLLSGWGSHRMANELNRLGVPSRRGKPWTTSGVYRVLLNPTHAGLMVVDGDLRPGNFAAERYWERETYDQLRAEISRHRRVPAQTQTATQYLLSEVLTCQGCGRRTYGIVREIEGGRLVRYYWCRTRPSLPGCHRAMIRAEVLESTIIEELRGIALGDEMQRLAEDAIEDLLDADDEVLQDRCQRLKREHTKLEDQFNRWADQLTSGKITQNQFDCFNVELSGRLEACQAGLEEAQRAAEQRSARKARLEKVRESLRDFGSIWGSLDEAQRRHLVGLLIERATLEWRGHESVLRMKPFYLPEREVTVRCKSRSSLEPASKMGTLTPRQLSILHLLDQGLTTREIAQRLGLESAVIRTYLSMMHKGTGIADRQALIESARPLIQRQLHFLPVSGRAVARPSGAAKEPNALVKQVLTMRAHTHTTLRAIAQQLGCKLVNLHVALRKWYARLGVDGIDGLTAEAQRRGWICAGSTGGDDGDTSAES